jgi:hypothetical protein
VASLLQAGAVINATDSNGLTALHVACVAGQLPVVEALLAHGSINVDSRTRDNCLPVHLAAKSGALRVVARLVEGGFNAVDACTQDWEVVHVAAINGNTAMVSWLLEHGADPCARGTYGGSSTWGGWM